MNTVVVTPIQHICDAVSSCTSLKRSTYPRQYNHSIIQSKPFAHKQSRIHAQPNEASCQRQHDARDYVQFRPSSDGIHIVWLRPAENDVQRGQVYYGRHLEDCVNVDNVCDG
jgi:hypothetical protein